MIMMVTDVTDDDGPEVISEALTAYETAVYAGDAVLDGGAESSLGGRSTVNSYLNTIHSMGFDIHQVKFHKCSKNFRFGNDAVLKSHECVMLPVAFGGQRGYMLVYIIETNTPFLFPRPLMEQLKLIVDYGRK